MSLMSHYVFGMISLKFGTCILLSIHEKVNTLVEIGWEMTESVLLWECEESNFAQICYTNTAQPVW